MCGQRLEPANRSYLIGNISIAQVYEWSLEEIDKWLRSLNSQDELLRENVNELQKRLQYLLDVGVGYLSLNRLASSLSGGELQRIHMARSLGNTLTNTLFV